MLMKFLPLAAVLSTSLIAVTEARAADLQQAMIAAIQAERAPATAPRPDTPRDLQAAIARAIQPGYEAVPRRAGPDAPADLQLAVASAIRGERSRPAPAAVLALLPAMPHAR